MKGLTYFKPWAFSINEGQFPNIHISWHRSPIFYLALTPRWTFVFSKYLGRIGPMWLWWTKKDA